MTESFPLFARLPAAGAPGEAVLERFLEHVSALGTELYPAQEEAILELLDGKNVILNTPTGSGKSLVASALHFESLANGRRSYYTSPIKALVNEKFLALCRDFGPDRVGLVTGDASVNPEAPILCCTAEILAIDALRFGERAPVADVVMDEFHYYSDRERGVAWQVPLLSLKNTRFLLMSATLGDTEFFEREMTKLNGRVSVTVRSTQRPVPLEYRYSEDPLHEAIAKLVRENRAPIYVVNFTQAGAADVAQSLMSVNYCSDEEKKRLKDALEGVRFTSPYGKEISRYLRHGVGIHHAGLLPKYRILVERLAQKGLLKIICGTDTLGVGVNVPIRTVLFTQLCKYDGERTAILTVRDFHQIAGRAGRKGFDDQGLVVAQAPEHVIENLVQERKAAGDPKKLKKIVKRKPPERGFVMWTEQTFRGTLIAGKPEALQSRFSVTHGMLLNVLSRPDGCEAMRDLIRRSHESEVMKKRHRRTAFQLFRSLVERKIIEFSGGGALRLNVDLQEDFSLNHALSLWLVDTLAKLDPQDPDYAPDVLTLVESILENPDAVLRAQLNRLKGDKVGELKAEGMDYDQRMEELEKLEYPKPRREFIYETFNAFAEAHPWVGQDNIRPKSIAREMVEIFASFPEYVREYGLQRSEGVLLRYLSEAYKVLVQSVPDALKNDEVLAIEEFLRAIVRGVDSSLLDEWERMRDPAALAAKLASRDEREAAEAALEAQDFTRNRRALTIALRNECFRILRCLSQRDYAEAAALVADAAAPEARAWTASDFEAAMAPFWAERSRLLTDTRARDPRKLTTRPSEDGRTWAVEQVLSDPEGLNDFVLKLELDFEATRSCRALRYHVLSLAPL